MSILSRWSRKKAGEPVKAAELPRECGHWELAPRWDAAPDIGIPELVVFYECTGCKSVFTPDEVKALRDS
jgi:hypothetical protein